MKASKLNRTHFVYSGILTIGVDLDDNARFKIVAANKGTNGRYNNVMDVEVKPCDLFNKFAKEIAKSVYEHCNLTYKCPHKKHTCEMKNWLVNFNVHDIPALPYGEYRIDGSLLKIHQYKRKELISCVRSYALITPKKPVIQKKASLLQGVSNVMT
ncbi:uncharacterized protein LOC120350539 [Nilaparvata lugens]|uniref:uncharacterized protein LOC120350539 n=1 Tax=Nilaparvata lugens TaxID=108931 RepID=UPI00193E2369|nr:uncharacterized protein LOC120350539 [Nilaparvata lugens]